MSERFIWRSYLAVMTLGVIGLLYILWGATLDIAPSWVAIPFMLTLSAAAAIFIIAMWKSE